MNSKANILIITVNKIESQAVMRAFREATGKEYKPESIGDRTYHNLGEINAVRVFMALSEMGSGGPGGSQEAVRKGIEALAPSVVVLVGIAFGVNEQKQAIGDILVSQQIWLYELQRIGKDEIIPRGDKPHASTWLIDRFRGADLYWDETKAKVRFGVVLSGEKLVDDIDYREQLKKFEPEAIGGEMEGAGLYVASLEKKVDWIVVKAISDWADGKKAEDKDARQQLAATNAASFVIHALQQAPLKRDREPDYHIDRWLVAPIPIEPRPRVHSSLPAQAYFFGREKEMKTITEAILPEARTWGALIDGPGGIGKTALAIRAGHLAPTDHFERKIFLSAKKRELTPAGERTLEDFMLPNFIVLITELARELGADEITRIEPNERANAVRRALADVRVLIVIDNVESFDESERVRLYQFLSHLPEGCKAIVTSRRRVDIDARVVRLDRLERKDALDLMAELAKNNRHLERATEIERGDLYEITNGNPLLIKWTVGQLGREGGHCRTIPEACAYLKSAPEGNDPLEFIFGDLLDTFTESETAVLDALAQFTQPAKVKWIADVAGLAEQAAITALEDLTDRALLVASPESQQFLLPSLAATFIRGKRPEAITASGRRLIDRAYALALENGYQKYERFSVLESEWQTIADALPLFVQGENDILQSVCDALDRFLDFSGRWDEWLALSQQAEEKALFAGDRYNAGWRAFQSGWVYRLRRQADEVLTCAERSASHFEKAQVGAREKAYAIRLRCLGHEVKNDYPAATRASQESLDLLRAIATESSDVANALNDLAMLEHAQGDYASAERDYREALRMAMNVNYREGVAFCTGNLAALSLDQKNWGGAEELARDALRLAEGVGRQQLIGSDCHRLAEALAHQGKPDEGLPYARRAVEIYTKLRMPDELKKAQAALEECGG